MGFIVEEQSTLAPLNYSPIKTSASQYVDELSGITVNLPLGASVTIPSFCAAYGKLGQDVPGGTALAGWFQTAGAYCQDLIGKYKGLAADPPDPNYKVFAELGDINYGSYTASTPLERAARTLANAMADQDAASNAFLNSIQKFQGAQQASDDEWTMLQLMQMNKDINLLVGSGGSMLRTYAALQALNFALQQDPLGTSPDAQNLEALLPTMEQALGAMLTPMGGFFQPYFDGFGDLQLRPVGLQAYIQVYLGQSYDTNILPGIPQERALEGLPPIVLPYPTATTGGNYNAAPGTAITLNASQSTDPNGGSLTYAWDLNGNGTFTDATGAQPQYTYSQPGTRTIAVQVTDSSGNTNIAYGLANIGDVNSQDIIVESGSDQIYDVHPDGSYAQLTPGLPYINSTHKRLQVDINGDIWELDQIFGLQHFNSSGNLVATITPSQVSSLLGIPLQPFDDFAIDGSGNIDLTVFEDFGTGIIDFAPFGSYATDLPGHSKLIRIAPDGSSAKVLDDLSQPYLSIATVNGVLTEYVDPTDSCYGNPGFVRVDPNTGDIIVSNVNNSIGAIGNTSMCSDGVLSINPTTAAITVMIPPTACDGYGCQSQTIPPFGTFGGSDLTFGGSSLHWGSMEASHRKMREILCSILTVIT
ncbi:MAG: PKD domain-containing protein [Candidatus Acidiferrales bacterium]